MIFLFRVNSILQTRLITAAIINAMTPYTTKSPIAIGCVRAPIEDPETDRENDELPDEKEIDRAQQPSEERFPPIIGRNTARLVLLVIEPWQ